MAKTVMGLFNTINEASQVVQELIDNDFERDDISIVVRQDGEHVAEGGHKSASGMAPGAGAGAAFEAGGGLLVGLATLTIPGIGPVSAAGPLATSLAGTGVGAAAGDMIDALTDLGVPEEEAQYYAEGVRRGGALVAVDTDDDMADRAAAIMGRYGIIDVDEHAEKWRQSGWTRFDPSAEPFFTTEQPIVGNREHGQAATAQQQERLSKADEREVRVPIVEEQLEVGKRQVERGGVRLYTRIVEQPVEETVRLRDERVTVERHPVDRPASEADMVAFKEGTIEVTETNEEAVISKRTRVVEEVVVSKQVGEHTETVRDAARRTEVEVEPIEAERYSKVNDPAFEACDVDFRAHYNDTLATRGHAYNYWAPAYRYGYDLANDRRYASSDWTVVEPEAHRRWEERQKGTWEEFKDTIRYAWDKVRGRR